MSVPIIEARSKSEVLHHRQPGKDTAVLRHGGDALPGAAEHRLCRGIDTVQQYRSRQCRQQPEQRPDQCRLAHAVAAHQPDRFAGMGPEESEAFAGLLCELAQDHAILLVEHDMDVVFAVAHRMTVMLDGRVLARGAPADIRASPAVRDAYLGHDV